MSDLIDIIWLYGQILTNEVINYYILIFILFKFVIQIQFKIWQTFKYQKSNSLFI